MPPSGEERRSACSLRWASCSPESSHGRGVTCRAMPPFCHPNNLRMTGKGKATKLHCTPLENVHLYGSWNVYEPMHRDMYRIFFRGGRGFTPDVPPRPNNKSASTINKNQVPMPSDHKHVKQSIVRVQILKTLPVPKENFILKEMERWNVVVCQLLYFNRLASWPLFCELNVVNTK